MNLILPLEFSKYQTFAHTAKQLIYGSQVMIITTHQFEAIFERNIYFALQLLRYLKLDAR